jgi:hypothetical protein
VGSAKFEYFSMPLPNQTVKNKRTIMLNIKTSDSDDFKPVELTPSELDSVAGGVAAQVREGLAVSLAKSIAKKLIKQHPTAMGSNR